MSLAHLGQTMIPTKPQGRSVLIRGPRCIFYCLGMFDEHAKARKKRNKLEENDFYDSDEDEFFDRTGELSQKREKRKKAAGIKNNQKEKAMTHQEILDKLKDCVHNRCQPIVCGTGLTRMDASSYSRRTNLGCSLVIWIMRCHYEQ